MDKCKGSLDSFCYVCGHFMGKKSRHGVVSGELKSLYSKYFDGLPYITDQWYVPEDMCRTCYSTLLDWKKSKGEIQMSFRIPMFWSMPSGGKHDQSNCYACRNHTPGQNKKKMKHFVYKEVPSAQIPIPHTLDETTNKFTTHKIISPDVMSISTLATGTATTTTGAETEGHSLYDPGPSYRDNQSHQITEEEMDNIVADLALSKGRSEKLARILKRKNVLAPDARVTKYRKRQQDFQNLYFINGEKTYAYCNNPTMLMLAMFANHPYNAEEWRLFIDSSKNSLKVILLHVSNKAPSIPLAYSTETKETHAVLGQIMLDINYEQHQWKICCDLKVVTMLCGLQSGRTKHMCFLCKWVSTWKKGEGAELKYKEKRADLRNETDQIGQFNLVSNAIVTDTDQILFPLLHIKLGIVKSFIKTIYAEGQIAERLKEIFPGISDEKLLNGINYIVFIYLFVRFELFYIFFQIYFPLQVY